MHFRAHFHFYFSYILVPAPFLVHDNPVLHHIFSGAYSCCPHIFVAAQLYVPPLFCGSLYVAAQDYCVLQYYVPQYYS